MVKHTVTKGFSLLELSVVLVIIALMTSGVMVGQNLLRAAELRSITSDANKYIQAIDLFRTKYESLPGDMYNAIDLWGAADATPATCITTVSGTKATCNGDGSGIIGDDLVRIYEAYRAWQHLYNAGMITPKLTGVSVSGSIVGTNVPSHSISGTGFTLMHQNTDPLNSAAQFFAGANYNHILLYGIKGAEYTDSTVLPVKEAWSIDAKMDDGLPGSGKLVTYNNTSRTGCASTDDPNTAIYQLDIAPNYLALPDQQDCNLIFITGF